MAFQFRCPWCDAHQVVTSSNHHVVDSFFAVGKTNEGFVGSRQEVIRCSNPECLKITVSFGLQNYQNNMHGHYYVDEDAGLIWSKRLMPSTIARQLPEYIPMPLREDYEEACSIKDLSPKAAATLARRCLQGMIRDFCNIKEKTLNSEITKLRTAVDGATAPSGVSLDSVDAIDHVRQIGNIGAHMEKDINNMVDVSAEETQVLIDLLESLFDEWYVAREKRRQRFEAVRTVAAEKRSVIEGFSSPKLSPPDASED